MADGGNMALRLVTSIVGAVAGAISFGALLGSLAYRVTDPRGEFGYEFEGVFHVLVLGAVGGVVGAVGGSALGLRLGGRRGAEGSAPPGRHPVLVRALWEGGLLALGALAGLALGLGMSIAWQVDLSAMGWVLAAAGGIAGFLGGRALADRSPAERG